MSLYGAFDKTKHFDELDEPLDTGSGVLTPAARRALVLANLGITALAAEVNVLAGVTAGSVSASKAVVVDANSDISGFRNVTLTGKLITSEANIAASGSTGSDATAITAQVTRVTGSDGSKGVILPVAVAGMILVVRNTVTTAILKLYPNTGAAIDAGAADAVFNVLPGEEVIFVADTATQWYTKPGLRIARGQQTTSTATDTVVTGLRLVAAAVASYETDPADANFLVTAVVGDQSGAPAAGSIIIKSWKTDGTDPTPVAATSLSKVVNWIAIGN